MRPIIIALLLMVGAAHAQDASLRYASFPDYPTALSVSQSAWAAVQCTPQPQCDKAKVTTSWYPIVGLSDGTYAVVIHSGDVFQGEHIAIPNGKKFDLTANQIASLATRSGAGTKLCDFLQVALVGSRITAPQMTAINAYANAGGHSAFKTEWTTLQSGPVDLQATLPWDVMGELVGAGVLTATDETTILAPNASCAVIPATTQAP